MDISLILLKRYPNSQWTMNGEDYSGLVWLSINPKPTEDELLALWPVVLAEFEAALNEEKTAQDIAMNDYPLLPTWARTGTAVDVETYITNQIWNGQTIKQVETWIDINIADLTIANIAQINIRMAALRQGLKLVAGAVISMRDLFILTAKLLIYIRDLVIRFRSK